MIMLNLLHWYKQLTCKWLPLLFNTVLFVLETGTFPAPNHFIWNCKKPEIVLLYNFMIIIIILDRYEY